MSDTFYADARIAYGQSYNSVSPYNTYSDDFDAIRWLASAALIGDYNLDAFTIRPELRLSWFREESDTYTDTPGNRIPSIEVETGELLFGPTITTSIELEDDITFTPSITLQGIWTFAQENTANRFTTTGNPQTFVDAGLRGRLEAGFDISNDNGTTLGLSATYDGIGDNLYESWGIRASIGHRW